MDALLALRRDTGVCLVEDCSHAHGAKWKGRVVGTLGDAGCWSLQAEKLVSAGEGGVLATDDSRVFERACLMGQLSRMGALSGREHVELQPFGLGMKLRAHPLGIAIAGIGMDRLPEVNRRRRAWVETVEAGLSGVPGFRTVKVFPEAERVWYREFPVLHLPEEHRGTPTSEVIDALRDLGVPASGGGFPLLHRLPLFAKGFDLFTRGRGPLGTGFQGYREGDLPGTEAACRCLVFFPVLTLPDPGAAAFLVDRVHSLAIRLAGDRGRCEG
jgi:dTDP-4-amino-4,6-dideoxygalactose transaminase